MGKQLGLALCLVPIFAVAVRAQNPSKDEREIRALAAHWQQDWNRDDAKVLASLLAVDADYVTDNGNWLEGRTEFENWRGSSKPPSYPHTTWTNNQVSFRFLQPQIAILHLSWTIRPNSPQFRSPGEAQSGISTWILVKLGAGWKIRAAQDTLVSHRSP